MKTQPQRVIFLGLNLFAVLVLVCAAIWICFPETNSWETELMRTSLSLRTPTLTPMALMVAHFGNFPELTLATILIGCVFCYHRSWATLQSLLIAVLGTTIATEILKQQLCRPRPSLALQPLLHLSTPSFPSGHASIATAFYGFLLYLLLISACPKYLKIICSLLTLCLTSAICLGRIYLAVHFPSDVLGGLGLCCSFLSLAILYHQTHSTARSTIHSTAITNDNFQPQKTT